MLILRYIIISIIATILFFPGLRAQSVGVSPAMSNLGEIQAGTSKIVKFQIVTVSDEVTLVSLGKTEANIDVLIKGEYKYTLVNYSEQNILPWIEFINNPIDLFKTEEKLKTKAGNSIKNAREVSFILKVPKNAEPGYHMAVITLEPLIQKEGKTLAIQGVVPFKFIFKVPGKAIREGKIFEISSGSYNNGNLMVDVFFQNTGTVTMSALPMNLKIFDKKNSLIDSLTSPFIYLKPGGMQKISLPWNVNNVDFGFYDAEAKINYYSDFALKRSSIEVYEQSKIPQAKVVEKEVVFPWWIVVIVALILIVAYIYYKR